MGSDAIGFVAILRLSISRPVAVIIVIQLRRLGIARYPGYCICSDIECIFDI